VAAEKIGMDHPALNIFSKLKEGFHQNNKVLGQ